jgi:hypothetical protein
MKLRLALVIAAFGAGACGSNSTSPTPSSFVEQFDAVWKRYDETYAYFEYKKVNWDSLRTVFRPRAEAATSQQELAFVVRDMLGPLRDVHAWLVDPSGAPVVTYSPNRFVNWNRDVWQSYMQRFEWQPQPTNWGFAMAGQIPILYFGQWNPAQFTASAVDGVFEAFRSAPAMIIDVRMNGGGDSQLALDVAGRFFDSTRVVTYVRYRNGPKHTDFGALQPGIVAPRGPWQFTKPVIVLVGRACFSSTEMFVAAMRTLPNVTIVGDTTGGGSGNPALFDLGGGWRYTVPRWIEYTTKMEVVEWQGLPPHIVVPTTSANFTAGRDPVLDYALQWVTTK